MYVLIIVLQISGLPTDNSEDNPFGYSPLHEERDEHQYSSPMLNVDQVEFKPRKWWKLKTRIDISVREMKMQDTF